MLRRFKYIRNVGRYRALQGTDDTRLEPLTLVFSENGRGKTTLCAILRSLAGGSADPILERRRLDNDDDVQVVLELDTGEAAFDGTGWTKPGPPLHVFDEVFVEENVYSGLTVDPSHRQGVHSLVLGKAGVQFQKRVEELTEEVAQLQSQVSEKQTRLTPDLVRGLSVDEFCGLQVIDEIETRIEEARRSVEVLKDTESIRTTAGFDAFALPALDLDELEGLLGRTLDDIDQEAVDAVAHHLASLGSEAEEWIATGELLRSGGSSCPYCGQNVGESALVSHYRGYFSSAYEAHKAAINRLASRIRTSFGGDHLAAFERDLQQIRDRSQFWRRFAVVGELSLDSDAIATAWTTLRDELLRALVEKSRSPLEVIRLTADARAAKETYEAEVESVRVASAVLLDSNEGIEAAKEQAGHGNLEVARNQFARLEATKARFAAETDTLCSDLMTAKRAKKAAELRRKDAVEALDEQRDEVFSAYQTRLNYFLMRFNADFSIVDLKPSDRGRGRTPSTTYGFLVNERQVGLAKPAGPAPSFRTALSAGDRSTLALAFFFATLEGQELSDAIVVIDDPASSLDLGRSLKTIQEIRSLLDNTEQVILLSHASGLLCSLWEKADHDATATLKIRANGKDESTIEFWDAEAAAETDHDRLFALVQGYATSNQGDSREVAKELRVFLESFFRAAFPDYFKPGEQLGDFLQRCNTQEDLGIPILANVLVVELDELREYANRFHHATNRNGYAEALSNLSESELHAHCGQAIRLVERIRGGK